MDLVSLAPQVVVKPHQWETRDFLLSNFHNYNLSQMGTGKTLPAVLALKELFKYDGLKRVLVVAPLSVLGCVWDAHLRDFAPEVPRLLLNESSKRGRLIGSAGNGVLMINPDGVVSIHRELHNWKPQLIVVDEIAGFYRNMRTNRWAALAGLVQKYKIPVWPMTGTPMPKGLMDTYAQIMMVTPWTLPAGRNGRIIKWTAMREMLHTQPYPDVWKPKPGALERVYEMMQPAVRFTRKQVMADLAEPVRMRQQIDLSAVQKRMLAELEASAKTTYGDAVIKGAEAQALATKIVQIACGAVYGLEDKIAYPAAEARINAVCEIHEQADSPVILAVPYIHVAHLLQQIGIKKGYRVGVILGETNPNERTKLVSDFQAGLLDWLIMHPKTAAHGLTLTRSHTVIWYAPLDDAELYEQLNDRVSRYGQEEKPVVVELFATPIERKIYDRNRSKVALQGSYLEFFEGD